MPTCGRSRRQAEVGAANMRTGLVVQAHGRHCVVETPTGERVICHPRGKRLNVTVGDRVHWKPSHDEGSIEQVLERRNLLFRQDAVRTKHFAANLDQVLILLAAEPEFSEYQLARVLVACEAAHLTPLIVLNKADLHQAFERSWQRLQPYRDMNYTVLPLTAESTGDDAHESSRQMAVLDERLQGKITLVLGPSGAGKSTLVNRLIPTAAAATGILSQALGTGRHTTTTTTWYWLDDARRSALIDSPGFQEFGLHHIEPAQLARLMPDLQPHVDGCRFHNCTHTREPDCNVKAQLAEGDSAAGIAPSRYRIYCHLLDELRDDNRPG